MTTAIADRTTAPERITFPLPFSVLLSITKAETAKAGDWIIEGYATTTDLDLQGDTITPEAIRLSARDLLKYRTLLYNHLQDRPIGRILDSFADERGLYIKARISKSEPEIWQKILDGTLCKFSIRGDVLEMERVFIPTLNRPGRVIKRMRLAEASVVSVPANAEAESIAAYIVKALNQKEEEIMPEEKDPKASGAADAPPPQIEKNATSPEVPAPTATSDPAATVTPPTPEALAKTAVLSDEDVSKIVSAVIGGFKKEYPYPGPGATPAPVAEVASALDELMAWVEKQTNPGAAVALIGKVKAALGIEKSDGKTPAGPTPETAPAGSKVEKSFREGFETLQEGILAIATAVGELKSSRTGGLRKSQTGDPTPKAGDPAPKPEKGSFRDAVRSAVDRLVE